MAHPLPTQRFGKYQILERIAAGGVAELFKARLEGIGGFQRTFAIKRIRPGYSRNQEYIDALVDEAKIAGLLSHANIVQILDLGQVNTLYYVAMEYVDGRDLRSVLARCTEKGITLPIPHAVFICLELLKGLEYAHQRQVMRGNKLVPLHIVHRDLAPSNILVSLQGEVKLTDFGIAYASAQHLAAYPELMRGRYDYMSPEQARGDAMDQRSDIFSAGTTLYEMLCGIHPFRRTTDDETRAALLSCTYEPPSFTNPDVPYPLEEIIAQALASAPAERFQNSTDFKEALSKFFHGAGFIFSHATLAVFLKGLFPERSLRRAASLYDDETRPLTPLDIAHDPLISAAFAVGSPDEEGETILDGDTIDQSLIVENVIEDLAEEPTRIGQVLEGYSGDATQVRSASELELDDAPNPWGDGWDDEWDDEPATQIRAEADLDLSERSERTMAARDGRAPLIEKRPANPRIAERAPPPAPPPRRGPPAEPPGAPALADASLLGDTLRYSLSPKDFEESPDAVTLLQREDVDVFSPSRVGGSFGDDPRSGDESTAIRPAPRPAVPNLQPQTSFTAGANPLEESPTLRSVPLNQDAPTRFDRRPIAEAMPSDALDTAIGHAPPPEVPSTEVKRLVRADALAVERPPVERPPVEVAPTPAPGEPVVAPRSELPPFILGGLLLIAGLAVGFSMGALAMRALAVQTEPEAAAVLKSPPQLLVRAPDGARLFIDGRELTLSDDGATANLSAGDESRVRVEMDDFPPFEQAFTLDHNELRVLTVEFR